ncbi:MAG: hypothetical protein M1816_005989 [Peltula sp. TS41687]|nr:MAG: hypothetical protein M1816_005989 [Peltula sp. TS41687]
MAPSYQAPYTDWMDRPIRPAAYAWQNNLPYDSDFDEAMEYDDGEPMNYDNGEYDNGEPIKMPNTRRPIPEYQGTDNTATDLRYNEEYYSPSDDTDDL